MLRLLFLFTGGFIIWALVVGRGLLLEKRRALWLGCLVFVDDALGIGFGIFLARQGTPLDVIACAAGGACAAAMLVAIDRRYNHG